MTPLALFLPLFLASRSRASASAPPILFNSLTSQLTPSNPAISSVFIIPPSSALLANASSPFPAIRVPPSWSFSIGFNDDTFQPSPNGSQKMSFSAQLASGDPLPDWLVFAQDTITFGGVAPKASHGVQVLKIVVTATTDFNLSTSDAFTLIVSPHDLSLSEPLLTRNVTANDAFTIVLDDWQGVQVDGVHPNISALKTTLDYANDSHASTSLFALNPSNLNLSLTLDTSSFPWLNYVQESHTLSGTPPSSLAGGSMLTIPAIVKLTLAQSEQFLTVSTNLTLEIFPALFTTQILPVLQAPTGTKIAFALAPFLAIRTQPLSSTLSSTASSVNISATWDPRNVTWLEFDPDKLTLSGSVPQDAPGRVQVVFLAQDEMKGTASRTAMRISVDGSGADGGGGGRLPTNRALRQTGKKIKLAVGVVFGVAAAVIVLACLLAICRHCCVAREHVDGAYVIDQTAFDHSAPYKSSLEEDYATSATTGIDGEYLSSSSPQPPNSLRLGRTMTKGAFFGAVRARFGNDGSWTSRRNAGRNRNASENAGGSLFGSAKRPRKSKISKPMALLSSSTSIRDGFGDRGRGGIGSLVNGKGNGTSGGNFTIFGSGNNAGSGEGGDIAHGSISNSGVRRESPNHHKHNVHGIPPLPSSRRDVPHNIGRVHVSSPGTAILAYDRSRSNSDPSHGSVPGTDGSSNKRQSGSASAPSLGTGTHSGTQSTFATGDSTRLTNAAGEVPFRRSGFDGRWETLAERNMRETGNPLAERSTGTVGIERGIGSPLADRTEGLIFPPLALVKGTTSGIPMSSSHPATSGFDGFPGATITPTKSIASSKLPTPPKSALSTTPANSNKSNTPTKSIRSNPSIKSSPLNPGTSISSKFNTPLASGAAMKSGTPMSTSKTNSDRSLGAPASYRRVFFGDKGSESDSSIDDIENAIITHGVKRSSSETPVILGGPKTPQKQVSGKPRLVAFTHERTPAPSGQGPRRDVSQKAVLQGSDESDPEAEMRIGLEYVRQLGGPDSNQHQYTVSSASRLSSASDPTRTPSAEYYASNDSNNSIAGRTRVLAPLVINSHRGRHQATYSMGSTHNSFLSLADREGGQPRESRWMTETELPCFTFGAKEPFNFAVPLDQKHKHASALAGSALEARQADGRALPEWLRFDKGGKEFWGVTPKATSGEKGATLIAHVVVNIWDGEKGELVGGCMVDVFGDKE